MVWALFGWFSADFSVKKGIFWEKIFWSALKEGGCFLYGYVNVNVNAGAGAGFRPMSSPNPLSMSSDAGQRPYT